MKFLIVALVLGLAFWIWRKNRGHRAGEDSATAQSKSSSDVEYSKAAPRVMIRCSHCGLHFPETDAIKGKLGQYCSTLHFEQKERA